MPQSTCSYEAASIDGANSFQRMLNITLPWLRPMLLVILLLRTMDSIKVFDQICALTGGGPGISSLTVGVYAYFKGFRNFSLGYTRDGAGQAGGLNHG